VKRSQALQGRNLARDSQTDGASTKHMASDNQMSEAFSYIGSNTGAMPQKIPRFGAEPQSLSVCDSRLNGMALC